MNKHLSGMCCKCIKFFNLIGMYFCVPEENLYCGVDRPLDKKCLKITKKIISQTMKARNRVQAKVNIVR